MGNQPSLSQEQITQLTENTNCNNIFILVNSREIKRMHKNFNGLDNNKKGFVSVHDLLSINEIQENPLNNRIGLQLADSEKNDEVKFEKFINMIDIFKTEKKTIQQYKCNIYFNYSFI